VADYIKSLEHPIRASFEFGPHGRICQITCQEYPDDVLRKTLISYACKTVQKGKI
jgi:hypothetical protein